MPPNANWDLDDWLRAIMRPRRPKNMIDVHFPTDHLYKDFISRVDTFPEGTIKICSGTTSSAFHKFGHRPGTPGEAGFGKCAGVLLTARREYHS